MDECPDVESEPAQADASPHDTVIECMCCGRYVGITSAWLVNGQELCEECAGSPPRSPSL
jgi:formylmethanofuran dehydrogenase subunit E